MTEPDASGQTFEAWWEGWSDGSYDEVELAEDAFNAGRQSRQAEKDALTARLAELEGAHNDLRSLYQEHGTIALRYCGDDPPEEAWSVHTMLLLSPSLHLEAPGQILGSGPTPEAAIQAALAGKDAK